MDFLNKALAQVSELFRSMTPGARITAGLLLAIVVISLGYLFKQGAAGPDAYLFGGQALSDGELSNIEVALGEVGLTAVREGNRIRVSKGQQAAALAAIADAGALPPNFSTILEKALNTAGPWESREATRERLKIAKQQTLREIIRAMYWVDDAMVLYDEQAPRGISGQKQVTGSVSVRPTLGESLNPRRTKALQKLVAHAVVGMKSEDVAVTNLGDGTVSGSDGSIYPEIFEDAYQQTRVAFEMQKRESIMNALRDIPGVRVEVNAEFDATVEEQIRNVKPDPKPQTRREVTSTDRSTQATGKSGGQPGVTANGPNRQGASESPQQNTNETSSETTETENVVGVDESRILKKGYVPKEVWATVTIPSSYIESLWKRNNPTATDPPKPEDLEPIKTQVTTTVENIVEPLLLLQANKGQNTYKYVIVEVLPSLPAPAIEPPSTASQALAWAGRYWSTVAMLGVAMFSLLVLRSVVKAAPSSDGPVTSAASPALTLHAETPVRTADNNASDVEEPVDDRPRLRLRKGKSFKDDLVSIVHDDPDAAAEILRSWIGKAS